MEHAKSNREQERMAGKHGAVTAWRRWGPYAAERSWGTVREDYSENGNAWAYFPHDHARSRAYRWGEDGLAAICDRYQLLCFAMALWNERDPILKERLFGVVPSEGNHGEDVKEYYFYLDSTPSHSYMKWLYKYPQREYPYQQLVEENQRRGGRGPEFELLDTGLFDDDRYFDVFVEYAKVTPEDMAVRVTIHNRGPEPAPIQVLPHLWFRNTWAWGPRTLAEPSIVIEEMGPGRDVLLADLTRARDARINLPGRVARSAEMAEVRTVIPDRPGAAAEVFTLAAELGVNVTDFEVYHSAEGARGVLILLIEAAQGDLFRGGLIARGFRPSVRRLS